MIVKSVFYQLCLALYTISASFCLATTHNIAGSDLTKRAAPLIENGDFEQGPLPPAWTSSVVNAGLARVKQPGNRSNHVVRITPHHNPCFCEDDQCPEVTLTGTMINLVPGASYSITWNFLYIRDLSGESVSFFADAYKCDQQSSCESASFSNVQYPTTVRANKWYTYSASFTAVDSATDGRMSLSLNPGGCSTAAIFLDNFRLFGPF